MVALVLLIAAAIVAWATLNVWRLRRALGGRVLFAMMTAVLVWTIATAAEAAVSDLSTKIILSKIEYLGEVSVAPLLLIFSLIYTHRNRLLTRRNLIFLWITPAVIFLLVMTNEIHHLIWKNFIREEYLGDVMYIYVHGPAYLIHIVFSYACTAVSAVMLIHEYRHATKAYRRQYGAFILACLAPIIGSLLYIFNWNPLPGLDLTAISFSITGILITYGTQVFGLLDLIPIARHTLVEAMEDGMIVIDMQNRIVDVNQAVLTMFGFTSTPLGEDVFMTFHHYPLLAATLLQKPLAPMEISLPDRKNRHIDVRLTEVLGEQGQTQGYIAILRDITDRKKIEAALEEKRQQMERMAITDDLTGLYNRRHIDQVIEREFRRAERYNVDMAIALFDLDNFKQINDEFGHTCGDEALRTMAKAILSNIRTTDIAARMGGDEFLIIFPHTTSSDAWQIMERLRTFIGQMDYGCGHLEISISGGVVSWKKGIGFVETIRRVDNLLYEAKRLGKNRIVKLEEAI